MVRKVSLLLVLLVAFPLVVYLVVRPGDEGTGREVVSVSRSSEPSRRADADLATPAAGVDPARPGAAEERVEVDLEEENSEPSWLTSGQRQWLEGRVLLPANLPRDEKLFVLALEEELGARDLYADPGPATGAWEEPMRYNDGLVSAAEVASDGSFRVALPQDAVSVHLALSGRYLFSRRTQAQSLPATGAVAIQGELGAWVTGQLQATSAVREEGLSWEDTEVELGPDILASGFRPMQVASEVWEHESDPDDDGRFEFRAVNTNLAHGAVFSGNRFSTAIELGIELEPGEHLELTLPVTEGAILEGIVVDEAGTPLPEVDVEVHMPGVLGRALGELREAETDAEGRFRLEKVMPGKLELEADLEGYRDARLKLDRPVEVGEVLGNLEIVMERGALLAGRVAFPDGTGVQGASLFANPDVAQANMAMGGANLAQADRGGDTSDEDGRFEITGLSDMQYSLTAQREFEEGDRAGQWKMKLDGLDAGTTEIEVVLERLATLRGTVTDVEGTPVPEFDVRAVLSGSGAMFGIGAQREGDSFEDEQGRFELKGLTSGSWEVTASADGFATSKKQVVEIASEEPLPEVQLVLPRAASVSGQVVDVGGSPVSGAQVSVELELADRISAMQSGETPEVYTDSEGRFVLGNLDPGSVNIVAALDGFASSEPVACDVESGKVVRDVVLQLRLGGTLTGQVLNEEGEPDVGKMVIVQRTPSYTSQHMLNTDGAGEFRVEHLEPGSWQVVVTANFLAGDMEEEATEDMAEFLGQMKIDFVEIKDGEDHHVLLGAPPEDPVTLKGKVMHAGEPQASVLVSIMPEGAAGLSDLKMKMTQEDGTFETVLDKPGGYLISVQQNADGMGQQQNTEFLERIPEGVEEHEILFDLPLGRISGKVYGPDGEPVSGCRVTLNVQGGVTYGSFMGGHYSEITTDASGAYDITCLRPGKYSVSAGGVPMGGLFGGTSPGGRVVQSGLELEEGEWLDSIDFRLQKPGTLRGTVVDAGGKPVPEATIFVRDEAGRLLEHFSLVTTDSRGVFNYEGVSPGRYSFEARTSSGASEASRVVNVPSGGVGQGEATLQDGTILLVSVLDSNENDVQARFSIFDSAGREYTTMRSMQEIMEAFGSGVSTQEHRIGPVAPGTYRLVATTEDGRTTNKPVTLSGQPERKIKLRLK